MQTTTIRAFARNITKPEEPDPSSDRAVYTKAGIAIEVGKHQNTITRYNVIAIASLYLYKNHCETANERIASNLGLSSYQRQVLTAISKLFDHYSAGASAEQNVKRILSEFSKEFNNVSFSSDQFYRKFINK